MMIDYTRICKALPQSTYVYLRIYVGSPLTVCRRSVGQRRFADNDIFIRVIAQALRAGSRFTKYEFAAVVRFSTHIRFKVYITYLHKHIHTQTSQLKVGWQTHSITLALFVGMITNCFVLS